MENYERNENLKEYIEKHIDRMLVAEEYKPLLVDILLRRACEFGFTSTEVKQDLDSIINNLDSIEVDEIHNRGNSVGVYYSKEKRIVLKKEFVERCIKDKDYESLYQVLTHEVYHSLSKDENGMDRLGLYNSLTGYYNNTLLEAIVEKSADRTVFNRQKNEQTAPYYHQNEIGYSNITFITDAIAAAYGMSEKSFLREAILERVKFSETLDKISREKDGAGLIFLDGIEVNFALLHKNFYGGDGNNKTNSPNKEDVISSMQSIYQLCEWKMQERIDNIKFESIDQVEGMLESLKYNHNKLFIVMSDAMKNFETKLGKGTYESFMQNAKSISYPSKVMISCISQILENKSKIKSEEETLRLINLAKSGKLEPEDVKEIVFLGIKLKKPKNKLFKISNKFLDKIKEQEFSNVRWHNKKISKIVSQTFKYKRPLKDKAKDYINNIKSKVKKVFGKKQKLLGSGDTNIQNEQINQNEQQNAGSNFAELTPDELTKFNANATKIIKKIKSDSRTEKNREKNAIKDDVDFENFSK